MLNIVLVYPEIPQNTGNISRTCAVIGATLHLVHPLGFDISEKAVKRAGLDYWNKVKIVEHESLQAFEKYIDMQQNAKVYLLTTKGEKVYSDVDYSNVNCEIFLIFGRESKGLPEDYILKNFDNAIRIPMKIYLRSLNLSNSVAIAAYEVLRQQDFGDLKLKSEYFEGK